MAKQFPIFPESIYVFENPFAKGEFLIANNPETMAEFGAAIPAAEYHLDCVGVVVDQTRIVGAGIPVDGFEIDEEQHDLDPFKDQGYGDE